MKVLVTGGRWYADAERLDAVLDELHAKHEIQLIIHGDYDTGADSLADRWARRNGVFVARYPANFVAHGRSGGPRRNQAMIDFGRPDLVVAFPGGTGTADTKKRAWSADIEVMEVGDGS